MGHNDAPGRAGASDCGGCRLRLHVAASSTASRPTARRTRWRYAAFARRRHADAEVQPSAGG